MKDSHQRKRHMASARQVYEQSRFCPCVATFQIGFMKSTIVTFAATRKTLVLIVFLSVLPFASPASAKTFKSCQMVLQDRYCEELVSSNLNSFLFTQTITLKTAQELDKYKIKTQITMGMFSCTPRVSKLNRFIFKDEKNKIVSISKRAFEPLVKPISLYIAERMKKTCNQLYP